MLSNTSSFLQYETKHVFLKEQRASHVSFSRFPSDDQQSLKKTSTIAASLEHMINKDILTSATGACWFYNKMRLRKDNSLCSQVNNNFKFLVNPKGHISRSHCWGEAFSRWLTKPFVLSDISMNT